MKQYFSYILISLAFLYLNLTPVTRDLRDITHNIVGPVSYIFSSSFSNFSESVYLLSNINNLQKENVQLKKDLAAAQKQVVEYQEIVKQTDFYENEKSINSSIIEALVSGKSTDGDFVYLTINKGSNSGITKNSTVVENGYLVGIINTVNTNSSIAVSIKQNFIEIPVEVSRSGSSGIFTCVQGSCFVQGVLTSDDVEKGDIYITSGTQGIAARGVLAGKVERIEQKNEDLFKTIYLSTPVSVDRLSYVGIIPNE